MDSFWEAVASHNWAQPEVRLEYRLYYDEQGQVLTYSMEDIPGNYIIVDRHTYEQARFDILIKDGKIAKLNQSSSWKLVPATTGNYACHKDNINIIVDNNDPNRAYWTVGTTHEAD